MARQKIRHQLFLSQDLSERLETLGAQPGASKSAILADALTAWLNRRGKSQLEDRFGARLDRIMNQLARIERDGHVSIETLALFVRYQLTVTAPLPEADKAGQAVGRARFAAFITRVGHKLASGRRTIAPVEVTSSPLDGVAS